LWDVSTPRALAAPEGDSSAEACYPLVPVMPLGLHSPLLERAGFRHAFFGRQGGVSEPPWNSLNFSLASGDDPRAVRTNLERAAAHLGVAAERIYFLCQVHGSDHRVVDGGQPPAEVQRWEGDIALSRTPELACGVRTADCAAVLLADRRSGAVAAIHSGWRSTVQSVVSAGLAALGELSGGPLEPVAAIGPHIEACCFEVGEDVAARLAAASPAGEAVVDRRPAKPHVDLRRIIAAQLEQSGVPAEAIDHVRGCTVCQPERFHSYRRDGQRGGRMLAAIVTRPSLGQGG